VTLAATDPFFLRHVWMLPLLMGLSFVAILFFGKKMPRKGSEIGIACVAACFVFSIGSGVQWIDRVDNPPEVAGHSTEEEGGHDATEHAFAPVQEAEGEEHATEEDGAAAHEEEEHHVVPPVLTEHTWWSSGGVEFEVGTFVDGLSVMMLLVVSLISLLVHVYSTDYVGGDRRYTHYFAFLSLFTASMLLLVVSRSTVQFITAWELVGLCSFALIGHWWEEKPNSDAALKAFLTNRVGDIGLMIGMIVLFFAAGSFDIPTINEAAVNGEIRHLLLLVASCCLVGAVMSKSGQFVLHTWLPDAMAGPTPVSALIHAATMVVAGIFMVARFYGVFFEGLSIGTSSINLLAIVGAVTLLGAGLLAFVQNDIKKVLAYSTVSQLGYMAMALGVGAWTAALFHLFTHAFFKAGLFLGSGSVAHSVHSFDMKQDMGGMKRFMPRTYATFLICSAALAALIPLSGFWSKDEILAGAWQLGDGGYPIMFFAGLIGGGLTAAYMTRCVYLTFHGEPRGKAADPHHPPHESGPRILVPLYILSGLAVVAGLANIPNTGAMGWWPDSLALRFEHFVEPTAAPYFPGTLETFHHPEFTLWIAASSVVIALVGIALSYAYWFQGRFHGVTERVGVARAGHTLLVNKYYFDHLYTGVIANGTKGPVAKAAYWVNQNVIDGVVNGVARYATTTARWTYKWIDQGTVDGIVNSSGAGAEGLGQALRQLQTGKVQQYGALLFGGAVILAGIFIFAI
jgi:NADH-quinone oxidoreductase subunit L